MPTKEFREKVDSAITGGIDAVKDTAKKAWTNLVGTEEQNAKSRAEMKAQDEKYPDSTQAKVNRALGMKSGGKVSSASKRADGIAQRGKTRGRLR